MSIALLVGGSGADGDPDHRHLVGAFLERFGARVTHVVTTAPPPRVPLGERLRRALRRGDYLERLRRARWHAGPGPHPDALERALEREAGQAVPTRMPGAERVFTVRSHDGPECAALLDAAAPEVLVAFGTRAPHGHPIDRARLCALNLHLGLWPWYRGDSALFWPVHGDEPGRLGVTVHRLVAGEGGGVAATARIDYRPGDTEADLHARAVAVGTEMVLDAVEAALAGRLRFHEPDLSLGREFRRRERTVAAERRTLARLDEWAYRAATHVGAHRTGP